MACLLAQTAPVPCSPARADRAAAALVDGPTRTVHSVGVTTTADGPTGGTREAASASTVLAALAEPRRAAIVSLLEQRHRSQKGLSQALGLSQPLLSHHLRVLREAGLVRSTVCGRITVYLLNATTLRSLCHRLEAVTDHAEALEKVKPC